MSISPQRYPLDSSLSFIACVSVVWGGWGVGVTELREKREEEPVSMFKTLRERDEDVDLLAQLGTWWFKEE